MIPKVVSYNQNVWRIISTRFPPINLFEDVACREDFDALYELEMRTNPRIRNIVGAIELVPANDRIYGAGSSYIMSAFTHLNGDGSRFSDGSYGVFYAADTTETAIQETKHHRARFLSYTSEPAMEFDMRVLRANLNSELHDITKIQETSPQIYALDDYKHAQALGRDLRDHGSHGISYNSVRHSEGLCFAVFKPSVLSGCIQTQHLCYVWDGKTIVDVYEKRSLAS
jgi:hypothetical protein